MAKITKTFGATSTIITVNHMEGGNLVESTYQVEGRKSLKAAQVLIRKQLQTQNFFLKGLEYIEGTDERTIQMELEDFIAHSQMCAAGEQYPRSFVTATVKYTDYTVLSGEGVETVTVAGVISENRARRIIAEVIGSDNFLITETKSADQRRYMSREDFEKYGTVKQSANSEEEEEEEE